MSVVTRDHRQGFNPEGTAAGARPVTGQPARNSRSVRRSGQDAERCDRLRHRAISPPRRQRKRIRPSPCKLRTWTTLCECLRHLAKVAEEGFEQIDREVRVISHLRTPEGIRARFLAAEGWRGLDASLVDPTLEDAYLYLLGQEVA